MAHPSLLPGLRASEARGELLCGAAAAEIERLLAVLKLVDNYWTSGVREGAQPPWQEVRDALAHEQTGDGK